MFEKVTCASDHSPRYLPKTNSSQTTVITALFLKTYYSGASWLARKMLTRCALVNILTEVSITEEDCNDSVSCYSIGAGRTNSLSLLHLLLCHLFVSNFSVNRKGLFRPVPICDGAFFTIQCAYTDQSAARRQQSRPYFQRPTFFKLASDVSGG